MILAVEEADHAWAVFVMTKTDETVLENGLLQNAIVFVAECLFAFLFAIKSREHR